MPDSTQRHILDDLYASEINFAISTFWDGGFDVKLGDEMNGFSNEGGAQTFGDAVELLRGWALARYPQSEFAKQHP
jgi:hypothetical protein